MIDRRSTILRGLAAGAVIMTPTSVLPDPTSPTELKALAVTLDKSLEYVAPDKIAAATRKALVQGRAILKDTRPNSKDRETTAAALGMLGATQAPALWGMGNRKEAWSAYQASHALLNEGDDPVRALWVLAQQISSQVLNDRPTMALAISDAARKYARLLELTSHPNYARMIVTGEVRALIAVGHYERAHDALSEAVDIMQGAPPAEHIGLHQTGMSTAEFAVSVATRYNELAEADTRENYTTEDRAEAASWAVSAWPVLDKAGATGLRSYARIEMARTLAGTDIDSATELLLDVIEISRDRPMEQIMGKYMIAANAIAERDVRMGRLLNNWLGEWRSEQTRTRRFWENS